MKFRELKKHLLNEPHFPAYIVTGDDAFLIKCAVEMFEKKASQLPDLNISYFDEALEPKPIIEALEILPVMSNLRIVVVSGYKGDAASLLEYLANPNPTTVLLFVSPVLKENLSKILYKLTVVDCNKLDEDDIRNFITKQAADNGASFTLEAAKLLIAYCNSDLSRINSETAKLSLLRLGGQVVKEDVAEFVTADTDYKIYELSDAVASKDSVRASNILKSLIEAKIAPVTLLGMIYSHFRRLLYCAVSAGNTDLAQLLGVKEYAVKRAVAQAARYSPLRLKKICDGFHNADYSFKSGLINDLLALEIYVMSILSE